MQPEEDDYKSLSVAPAMNSIKPRLRLMPVPAPLVDFYSQRLPGLSMISSISMNWYDEFTGFCSFEFFAGAATTSSSSTITSCCCCCC